MSARDAVLLLTHARDAFVVDRVADGLRARGARAVRVDTDLFPTELSLAIELDAEGSAHTLDAGAAAVCVDDVRAVWNRRLWAPRLPDDLDPSFRAGCARESSAALDAFLSAFSGARWVDPRGVVAAAEDKPGQLREARAAGLTIPRTLVTNDPARVRAFRQRLGDVAMVTKMLSALSTSMEGRSSFVHTSLVEDADLDDLDGLRLCPMVFQELVPKRVELRVIHVAGALFTGAIDASGSARGAIDWRLARADEARWARASMPDGVAERLRAVMRALGLTYGAIDLIVRPDGEHVFLEVNPAGEWGMLERDLGLPIGDAIAAALLDA